MRPGTTEIGRFAVSLAASYADQVTGAICVMDGGLRQMSGQGARPEPQPARPLAPPLGGGPGDLS